MKIVSLPSFGARRARSRKAYKIRSRKTIDITQVVGFPIPQSLNRSTLPSCFAFIVVAEGRGHGCARCGRPLGWQWQAGDGRHVAMVGAPLGHAAGTLE